LAEARKKKEEALAALAKLNEELSAASADVSAETEEKMGELPAWLGVPDFESAYQTIAEFRRGLETGRTGNRRKVTPEMEAQMVATWQAAQPADCSTEARVAAQGSEMAKRYGVSTVTIAKLKDKHGFTRKRTP
jgi:hypothetical protein